MPSSDQPDLLTTYEGKRTTVFLGWDRPLCEAAADYLAAGWTSGNLDLTGLLVLVPTRQSGRKLRETLAAKISAGGGAVLPPLVTTPDALAAPASSDIASAAEVIKAWVDTLTSVDLHTIPNLFPIAPPDREFNWALHTATDFIRLRQGIGENGLLISDAAHTLRRKGIEPDRWGDLSKLERKVIARLNEAGLRDPQTARREAAERTEISPGITRVILLGTPDPSPLAVRILEKYSRSLPVEVVIYAPDPIRDTFDAWGRPEKIQWNSRNIAIPNPDQNVTVSPTPRAQASLVSSRISTFETPSGVAAIGIGDQEIIPHLRQNFQSIGAGTFDPAGTPANEHSVTAVLRHLRDLLESSSVAAFANLLRSADVLDALSRDAGESESPFDPIRMLRNLDDLANKHLPDNLTDLSEALSANPARTADVRFALDQILNGLGQFSREDLGSSLPKFLGWAFSGREFRADRPDDASTTEVARLVSAALDSMDGKLFSTGFKLGAKERLDLLLHLISSARITTDRRPDDIVLQGWLELLWEDAPQLFLTGFNEGMIPESIIGDHYLPDSTRLALGLRDNEERLARDAYLLTAVIESRRNTGRVEFLVGASSQAGDPLRPSRLLFKCDAEELPHRALHLFKTPDSEEENLPARTFPWKLHPPSPKATENQIESISVTGFAAYLRCPFRFFLGHNLGMREVEVGKMEMNPADFGTVIHEVLRRFGDDPEMRDCEDPAAIGQFLCNQADRVVAQRFGRSLPVPVLIQLESAKQRLGWVAETQAELRAAGWRIEHVEWKLGEKVNPWLIDAFPVTGTIDRIDRHLTSGTIRVLDYKTGKDVDPDKDHLGPPGSAELHDWEISEDAKGKPRRWTKLQLPLYLLAARELMGIDLEVPMETGYFHIPKSRSGCGIHLWEEISGATLKDATSCAKGVIQQIKDGIYWPPREVNPRYDDFSSLLFGSPEQAVDATGFENVPR